MFSQLVRQSPVGLVVLVLLARAMANSSQAEEPGLTGVWKDRSPERRAQLAREYGGTVESEAAVSAALDWIVRHQSEDGGWSFQHRQAACDQSCQHEGTMKNTRNAATGFALLALLGGGHAPNLGEHRDAVRRGCDFLIANQKHGDGRDGNLADGGHLYSHGIASQALCEAYGMSRDEKLRTAAEASVTFIQSAQHEAGGWRYLPKQPGDTSVTGWQLAALFAARYAGIDVPDKVFESADAFLDSVADDDGASYGYTSRGKGVATTAIGLWARTQFASGLKPDARNRGLDNQLKFLGDGTASNCYVQYYTTLAEFQRVDGVWRDWNAKLRDRIVLAQQKEGHARGSWEINRDPFGHHVGRLYVTALNALTLEVYYRYPPRLRVE